MEVTDILEPKDDGRRSKAFISKGYNATSAYEASCDTNPHTGLALQGVIEEKFVEVTDILNPKRTAGGARLSTQRATKGLPGL